MLGRVLEEKLTERNRKKLSANFLVLVIFSKKCVHSRSDRLMKLHFVSCPLFCPFVARCHLFLLLLAQTDSRCSKLIDDCVDRLKKEVTVAAPQALAAGQPNPAVTNGDGSSSRPVINGSAEGFQDPQHSQFTGLATLSSRRERLDSLLDGYVHGFISGMLSSWGVG